MSVPHFSFPFRLDASGSIATLEQDTWQDVAQCVQVLLTTREGDRIELPTYGVPDPVFKTLDSVDSGDLLSRIGQWEKRAAATLDITADSMDEMIQHIRVNLLDIPGDSGESVSHVDKAEEGVDDEEAFGLGGFGLGEWGE